MSSAAAFCTSISTSSSTFTPAFSTISRATLAMMLFLSFWSLSRTRFNRIDVRLGLNFFPLSFEVWPAIHRHPARSGGRPAAQSASGHGLQSEWPARGNSACLAVRADPAERDLALDNSVAGSLLRGMLQACQRLADIFQAAAADTIKVVVLVAVGVIARPVPTHIFDSGQLPQSDQVAQGVIGRRAGNLRHYRLHPLIYLIGRGMAGVIGQQFKDHPPLGRDFYPFWRSVLIVVSTDCIIYTQYKTKAPANMQFLHHALGEKSSYPTWH
jgi:hypothetical protein